ncbi:MAG: sensor histidine kinase [Cytophagaceae bacterium]
MEIFNRFVGKIYNNGIEGVKEQHEIEKLVTFNYQISICIVVSGVFILVGLLTQFFLLSYFSLTYVILFSAVFYFIHLNKYNAARNIYLFTTNYAVFTISFCFGYEAGFYFYFFTSPLSVYITYGNCKPVYRYLALSSYLFNAFLLNYLHNKGVLVNPGIFTETGTTVLFNLNLLTAFLMCFMFVDTLTRINKTKTTEAEELHRKQRILESEIHQKQLTATRVQFLYQKLEGEYQQLDMFSHIISHNLRGPISRVNGILELLKMHPYASEEQQKLMVHLETSNAMMDEIIKDLNFILVQKKMGQEATTEISLQEIFEEVKLLLYEEINTSGAEFETNLFTEKITSIKGIIISIFYNLISNSIKYTIPNQKPIIKIFATKSSDFINLLFTDEGIGFEAEKYSDKMFRLYNRFHHHVPGKGIGLFLIKSHVDMLGGKIQVSSLPRKGTKFTIQLPIVELNLIAKYN